MNLKRIFRGPIVWIVLALLAVVLLIDFSGRLNGGFKETPTSTVVAKEGRIEQDDKGGRFLVLNHGRRYQGVPGKADFQSMEFERYSMRVAPKAQVLGNDIKVEQRSTCALPLSTVTAFRESWVPSGNEESTAPFIQSAGPASRALTIRVLVDDRARNQRSSGTRYRYVGS